MTVELFVPEIEESLIAAMLQHRTASLTAIELGMTRHDYGNERNAAIHDAILRIIERGGGVDVAVVIAELEQTGMLDVMGGRAPVERLGVLPSDPGMVATYVHALKDRTMRRGIQSAFEDSLNTLYTEPDPKAALALVQKRVYREFDRHLASTHVGVEVSDLRTRYERRENMTFIPYSSPRLTYVTEGGIPLGGITMWGGHTNHGKTTQMVKEFIHTCRGDEVNGIEPASADFYALEMTEDQMVEKIIAQLSGVHPRKLRQMEDLSNKEKNAIDAAWAQLTNWDAKIYADPEIQPEDVRAMQLRVKRKRWFVDYLQRHDFRDYNELARMMKGYKNLAIMTNSAGDIGSQINPGEIRPGNNPAPIPNNNQLFGGKVLGMEADNVIMVWARQVPVGEGQWKRDGTGLYAVTKVRSGESDHRIDIAFSRKRLRWEETDGQEEEVQPVAPQAAPKDEAGDVPPVRAKRKAAVRG
jgi:replicative DNA helicase